MNRRSPNRPIDRAVPTPVAEVSPEIQELQRRLEFFRETLKYSDNLRTGPVPLLEKWTAEHVYLALYSAHLRDVSCVLACEAGLQIGRRLDLIQYSMRQPREFIVYEIKVSTSDFLREVRSAKKVKDSLSVGNRFYYVTPRGLLDKHRSQLPRGAGLIEVYQEERKRWLGNWRARTVVTARATTPADPMTLADIFVRRSLERTLNYPGMEIRRHVGNRTINYSRAIQNQERREWLEKMEAES